MKKCIVPGCYNTQERKVLRGITFHRIPKETKRRSSWLQAVGFPQGYLAPAGTVICSTHFAEEFFDRTSYNGLIRLRENAFPTIGIAPTHTNCDQSGGESVDSMCYLYVEDSSSRVQIEPSESYEPKQSISDVQKDSKELMGIIKDIENQKLKQQLTKMTARYKASQKELKNVKRVLERRKHQITVMKRVIQQLTRERVVNE